MAQFVMVEAQKESFFDILWLHVITNNLQQQIDQSESFQFFKGLRKRF
jgi:hypothetical protein